MKLALIGAGGIAGVHCAAYKHIPQVELVAVADIVRERAEEKAAPFGAHVYTSLDDLLAAEHVDAVDICVPTDLHPEMTIRCLQAELHVLCEKPMSLERAGADAILAAWQRCGKFLMFAQVVRFWPEYIYLKKLTQEQTYGKLLQASFSRTSGAPGWGDGWYLDPARSGMAPFEMHIHDLDFIHYLLGLPESVQAYGLRNDALYVSYLHTRLFYPGVLVDAETGWYHAPIPFAATYRAVFERAVLDQRPDGLWLYESGTTAGRKVELESGPDGGAMINLPGTGPYYNEIAYFVECVEANRAPTLITPPQSRQSMELLFLAEESARTGEIRKVG